MADYVENKQLIFLVRNRSTIKFSVRHMYTKEINSSKNRQLIFITYHFHRQCVNNIKFVLNYVLFSFRIVWTYNAPISQCNGSAATSNSTSISDGMSQR